MTALGDHQAVIRVGIIGLGGAAAGMITKFDSNPRFRVTAAADIDAEILGRFEADYPGAEAHPTADGLCESKNVDFVYIGTPNRFHQEHAVMALSAGKHALVEKPMAVSIGEADAMVEAADRNGVLLGVNVKHSFEPRIQALRELTKTGQFGELRMMNHWRYQDWLYRPRTPEELTLEWGGGILWRQGGHQLDLLRTIGRGLVRSVRGSAQIWDPSRKVWGSHSAYFEFESGASGTCVYSGNAHYGTGELVYGFTASELEDPETYGEARRELAAHDYNVEWEAEAARAERYGGNRRFGGQGRLPGGSRDLSAGDQEPGARDQGGTQPPTTDPRPPTPARTGGWILGGPLIVSYDHADVRLSPGGLMVYGDERQWEIPMVGRDDGRDFRLNAFYDAIVNDRPLQCDGRWGRATVEVLLAIEQSGRERREVLLKRQVPYAD